MSGWWSLEVTPAVGGFQGPKHNRVGELQVPNSIAKWALGKVIGTAIQQTATVRVTRLFLDPYLLKHFIFFNYIYNWLMTALQYWFDFYHISAWINHRCTYVPSLLNLPLSSHPFPPLQVVTEPQFEFLSHTANFCWLSILHMLVYIKRFLFYS